MIRFFITFIIILAALFRVDMLDGVQQLFVEPWSGWLALASSRCMVWLDADVVHQGKMLASRATGFSVSVEAGCNGLEAIIVLIAGMLAFPSGWVQKIWGIVAGFIAVQVVNLLRIISLYYIGKWNMMVFEFAHLYLWQALIMLDVLLVWLLWVVWVGKKPSIDVPSAHAI